MKVVLLHDWLLGYRGGERVFEAFCEMFPQAPIYTLLYKKGTTSETIDSHTVHASFLNTMPRVEKHYRKFLPLFPKAIEHMKIIEEADLVLSSSHCVIKGLKKPAGSLHISYLHSPMRYLYDQFDVYFGKSAPLYQQWGARAFRKYLTNWDIASNKNVDVMIANSSFVQKRIQTYYGLNSEVIHPFVDLKDFSYINESTYTKKDYYIILSAFAPNKRLDLAVQAFNKSGKKLIIIGSGQQEKELKSMAANNIEFLGNVSRGDLIQYLAQARALIFPGVEDFGIVPLESLASGTPVIAYKTGGVLETLNESVAQFFEEQTVAGLEKAILDFESKTFLFKDLKMRAQEFSKEAFKEKIFATIAKAQKMRPQ